jgi:sporulation protein YlmC with PRC-barrel domain
MNAHILPALLLTAAFPLAAAAQDTTTDPAAPPTQQTDDMNSTTTGSDTAAPSQDTTTSPAAAPAQPADEMNSTTTIGGASADQNASAATTGGETFVTVPETGAWRVSDLQGKAVYDSEGKSIGEINDVLVSLNGSVNAVIIGVGGFLGVGEKDVAVNMSALQLGPGDTEQQAKAAINATPGASVDPTGPTGSVTGSDNPAVSDPGMTAMGAPDDAANLPASSTDMAANDAGSKVIGDDALPDRIILNVTREQLEKAPEFEGVRAQP